MGPVGGTYLMALLLLLGVLGALAWVLRPQLRRAARYFSAWIEHDRRTEQEALAQQRQRTHAEQEVRQYLHEDEQTETQDPLSLQRK